MDDQVAKHIKEMIRRITRKPSENQERPREPDTIHQIARTLRRETEYPGGLKYPAYFPRLYETPET